MPKFSEVFSTTWKALLALFLISVGLSVAYFIIGVIDSGSHTGSSDSELTPSYTKSADERHTKVPQSRWNMVIAAAIKQHCPVEGMSK